jgi:hypothetical protein
LDLALACAGAHRSTTSAVAARDARTPLIHQA